MINNSISGIASNAIHTLSKNSQTLSSALEKLSSGKSINRASDAPSGLVISELLKSQYSGTQRAIQNTQETNNVLAIAEGALGSIASPLTKARQLALHAANSGITSSGQVAADQSELNGILNSIQRIAETTAYSDKKLLNGSAKNLNLQLSDSAGSSDSFSLPSISLEALGRVTVESPVYEYEQETEKNADGSVKLDAEGKPVYATDADGAPIYKTDEQGNPAYKYDADGNKIQKVDANGKPVTQTETYSMQDLFSGGRAALADNPEIAMKVLEQAQKDISGYRADIGAYQKNTLETNANSLAVAMENLAATESYIADTDIAALSTAKATADILTKASIFGIQKLNQNAGRYLQLLGIGGAK